MVSNFAMAKCYIVIDRENYLVDSLPLLSTYRSEYPFTDHTVTWRMNKYDNIPL